MRLKEDQKRRSKNLTSTANSIFSRDESRMDTIYKKLLIALPHTPLEEGLNGDTIRNITM